MLRIYFTMQRDVDRSILRFGSTSSPGHYAEGWQAAIGHVDLRINNVTCDAVPALASLCWTQVSKCSRWLSIAKLSNVEQPHEKAETAGYIRLAPVAYIVALYQCGLQVIVDGMRVRVRLDQQRISSLLAGISPETMGGQFADVASGVLSMLGDMASLSFARYHTGVANESCVVPMSCACCPFRLHAVMFVVCFP